MSSPLLLLVFFLGTAVVAKNVDIVGGDRTNSDIVLQQEKEETSVDDEDQEVDDYDGAVEVDIDDYENGKPSTDPGLGTIIGGPCAERCSQEVLHAYCNKASNRCECDSAHPIALNEFTCIAPLRLGEVCNHPESCSYLDPNAQCSEVSPYYFKCACKDRYQQKIPDGGRSKCVPVKKDHPINTDVPTVLGVGVGMGLFTGLTCLVLRLFSNARFGQPRGHYADANLTPPPITLTSTPTSAPHSRRSSGRSSIAGDPGARGGGGGGGESRRQSYAMLAPPSRGGSRRASSSSVRSHASQRGSIKERGSVSQDHRTHQHETLRPTLSAPTPEAGPLLLPSPSLTTPSPSSTNMLHAIESGMIIED